MPTGIDMPRAGHNSIPMERTESYSFASSPSVPQAAIQFAESLTASSSGISAASKLVIASPIAIRAAAGASITAMGVLSPIVITSPR